MATPTLDEIKSVCTIHAKVFDEREPGGETLYHGEVWIDYGPWENIQVHQADKPVKRLESMERILDRWIKSRPGRQAIADEILLLAGDDDDE